MAWGFSLSHYLRTGGKGICAVSETIRKENDRARQVRCQRRWTYGAGEVAKVAGPREIREELGLTVAFEDLVPVGRRVFMYSFDPGVTEYEFQDVYFLVRNVRPEGLILQKDEVDAVLEMELEQGIGLFSSQTSIAECPLYGHKAQVKRVRVSADDFVPCLDNYYLKLLQLAKRYFSGERGLLLS